MHLFQIAKDDWYNQVIRNRKLLELLLIESGYLIIFEKVNLDKIIGMLVISMPMLVFVLLKPGSFGGGDVKLMAVAGWLLGSVSVAKAFWHALLIALVHIVWLIKKGKGRQASFPLGPFLCSGIILELLEIF